MNNRSRHSAPGRAGVYTRISSDPAGQRVGLERQRLDCEALCAARGWDCRVLRGQAARRVLAGQDLMTIARDWNVRGVPGATERPRTAPTLRKALLSARVAGLREHGTDPSGKVLGSLTPAVWEQAVDRQTWDHVRSVS